MATLQQIRDNVLTRLTLEVGVNTYWTNADIDTLINDYYKELATLYPVFRKVKQTNSVDGQYQYELPSDLLSLVRVEWDATGTSSKKILLPIYMQDLDLYDAYWKTTEGEPDWYFLDEVNWTLGLYPVPSANNKVIRVNYSYLPDTLTSVQSPAQPLTDGLLLQTGTLGYALSKSGGGQNKERAGFYSYKADKMLKRLLRPILGRKLPIMKSLDSGNVETFSKQTSYTLPDGTSISGIQW